MNKKTRPLACLLLGSLVVAGSLPAMAQHPRPHKTVEQEVQQIEKKTIVGTILDENEDPLPGASIRIEGTQMGVISDVEGNFSIIAEGQAPVLLISYIGMKTSRVPLTPDAKYIRAVLQPDATLMDEVIVTGYQNIKRENATGAFQNLTAKDMDKRYTGDITTNLEGKIPGLVTVTTDRYATGEDAITIRGVGTFNARTSPLVVVDGLPIEGGIESVNPYDIDNITVLKDAAAAAIYGARASNGVIVISTKRAKEERVSIDFNADLVVSEKQRYDNFNWASAADLIELEKYNFNAMLQEDPNLIQQQLDYYNGGRVFNQSQVMRLLLQNYQGTLSDADLDATLGRWARNDPNHPPIQPGHPRERQVAQLEHRHQLPRR